MSTPAIAVVNAGSSSLKFSLFALDAGAGKGAGKDAGKDADAGTGQGAVAGDLAGQPRGTLRLLWRSQVDGLGGAAPRFVAKDSAGRVCAQKDWAEGEGAPLGHDGALDHVLGCLRDEFAHLSLRGVGHRVVHGGMLFSAPTRLTPDVLRSLEGFIPLAPLHQPHNLAPIRRLLHGQPGLPQVACFDTAFHRSNPEIAQMFALPHALHDAGVRRYGFHGLSYEYIASVLPRVAPRAAAGRTVVLHLGNGASACALLQGRSIASSMGFTALDGLPMGTRCGALDPGVLLYLMDQRGLDARALEKLLYQESGLLGVSGVSGDMRALQASAEPRAQLAIELFVYRIAREIGSLAAALGGLDAIVFTAGIGENAHDIRERVCKASAWLGVEFDAVANAAAASCISSAGSACSAWVIPTDEELMIARHTLRLLDQGLDGASGDAADAGDHVRQGL